MIKLLSFNVYSVQPPLHFIVSLFRIRNYSIPFHLSLIFFVDIYFSISFSTLHIHVSSLHLAPIKQSPHCAAFNCHGSCFSTSRLHIHLCCCAKKKCTKYIPSLFKYPNLISSLNLFILFKIKNKYYCASLGTERRSGQQAMPLGTITKQVLCVMIVVSPLS